MISPKIINPLKKFIEISDQFPMEAKKQMWLVDSWYPVHLNARTCYKGDPSSFGDWCPMA